MAKDNLPILIANGTVNDTANGTVGPWNTEEYCEVEIFIAAVVFVAGTSPTLVFKGEAIDSAAHAYTQSTSAAISATAGGAYNTAIGAACATNKPVGRQTRLDYVVAGAPTSFSFYYEILARP